MSRIGYIAGRTTSMLSSDRLLSALRRTQAALLKSQNEITTGLSVEKPSEAPAKAAALLALQQALEARDQHERNLQHASGVLNGADQALGDATDLLIEARGIASSQVGIGSNADTRKNQASVIDAQIKSLIDIANRTYQGVSLFGGSVNPGAPGSVGKPVFSEFLGGVRYTGSRENLAGDVGLDRPLAFNSNGQDAFSALSLRVRGTADLDPQATAATRLADLNGTQGVGVRKGSVVLTVDGSPVTVDLASADALSDVLTRVNAAINGLDPTAGALSLSASGFSLTATAGHAITLGESGAGKTAADLGIAVTAAAATVVGADVGVRLTLSATLASLGAAVDFASGLKITQGNQTKVADFSSSQTIQDMANVVDQLGLGLRLEINDDGAGLNLISEVSGVSLSIGENGGATAADLGLRTLGAGTRLADFNFGRGVSNVPGDDFEVRLHDGRSFRVNIDGAQTVAEVVAAVQSAGAAAGVSVGAPGAAGTDFNIGLASSGNGLALEDGTAGAADFRVVQLGQSFAAEDLGIYANAGAAGAIDGADASMVRVEGVFTHLLALRDALEGDDSRGITIAGGGIEADVEKLAKARADVGVRAQRVEQQQQRSSELKLAEMSLQSDLRDADLTEVITRFAQLQQQLEASLRVGAQNLQMSFLDFLR